MSPDAQSLAYIQVAAEAAFLPGSGFFQHGTALQHSLSSEEAAGAPRIFLFDPRPKEAQPGRAVVLECTVTFLESEPEDGDDPLISEAIILRMSTLKDRFLAYLDQAPLLELEGIQWEAERLIYSSRYTGIVCKFTLKLPRTAAASACSVVA